MTITLCASALFNREVISISHKLQKMGFKTLVPDTASKMEESGNYNVADYKTWAKSGDYSKKGELVDGHFNKVVEGDAILVINNEKHGITGYIGGNVLMEMALAYYFKKKIYILNALDESLPIFEEVMALNPILLDGHLELTRELLTTEH